jgi:spermidine synthase
MTQTGGVEHRELARAESPRGEVVLRERRDPDGTAPAVLELRVNGVFVMDTLETSTERRLATAALALVEHPGDVLVGGLGLGFTAHEVLTDPRVERLVVVEVEEQLVAWMRDGTVPHGPRLLGDARLSLVTADIAQAIKEATPSSYDLVLLDVDNGPGYLVHESNEAIYRPDFLVAVAAVLKPGGVVVVWSAARSAALSQVMEAVFGTATALPLEVRLQDREECYWLYLARRGA